MMEYKYFLKQLDQEEVARSFLKHFADTEYDTTLIETLPKEDVTRIAKEMLPMYVLLSSPPTSRWVQ